MSDDFKKLATIVCSETSLGISSKTILAYCTETEIYHNDRPYDMSDVGRCVYLLSLFPEWKEKIKYISKRFPEWGTIGKHWEEIEKAYTGKAYTEKDNAKIKELLDLYAG